MGTKKWITIAIDGQSGCGKSTLAKDLAKNLQYLHLDSGGMYRGITLYCLKNNIPIPPKGMSFLKNIHLKQEANGIFMLNDENVTKKIRESWVSENVSKIAEIGEVRNFVNHALREMVKHQGVVMDGRDIGTFVFPNAECKFFIIADNLVRAKRRHKELKLLGSKEPYEKILSNLIERDKIDSERVISPLRKADDAIKIDTTNLTRKNQLDLALTYIYKKIKHNNA